MSSLCREYRVDVSGFNNEGCRVLAGETDLGVIVEVFAVRVGFVPEEVRVLAAGEARWRPARVDRREKRTHRLPRNPEDAIVFGLRCVLREGSFRVLGIVVHQSSGYRIWGVRWHRSKRKVQMLPPIKSRQGSLLAIGQRHVRKRLRFFPSDLANRIRDSGLGIRVLGL